MQLSGLDLKLNRAMAYVEARLGARRPRRDRRKQLEGARWAAQYHRNTMAAKPFEGGHLHLYEKLAEADRPALCQARTEKIGL